MAGVFAVARSIFEHELFADEPFTEREAWIWLIGQAAWKPTRVRVARALIQLARGQCAFSTRFIASRWQWSEARVRRFLNRLKTDAMIVADTDAHATRITICKYDEFQRVALPRDAAVDAPSDAEPTQNRRKEESTENTEEDSLSENRVSDPVRAKPSKGRTEYPADFEAAWRAYPTHKGMSKAEALPAWRKLSAEDRGAVVKSIPGYLAFLKSKPDLETVHFVRYLSKRRFDGFVDGATLTEDGWVKRLAFGRQRRQWSSAEWGPRPGMPGCGAPATLLLPDDGVGWGEWR